MHERQAAIILGIILVSSVIFANESFGEKYQNNAQGGNDGDKKDGDNLDKCKNEKNGHNDDKNKRNKHHKHHSTHDLEKQITDLQNQIKNIVWGIICWKDIQEIPADIADGDNDTLAGLGCSIGEIAKWNGKEWTCISFEKESSHPIFFKHSSTEGGVPEWVGTTNEIFNEADSDKAAFVMTSAGILSNLMAISGTSGEEPSPGGVAYFTITIIKNGEDTEMSCTITGDEDECSDSTHTISLNQGDTILLRVNPSSEAPLENIRFSPLLSPQ